MNPNRSFQQTTLPSRTPLTFLLGSESSVLHPGFGRSAEMPMAQWPNGKLPTERSKECTSCGKPAILNPAAGLAASPGRLSRLALRKFARAAEAATAAQRCASRPGTFGKKNPEKSVSAQDREAAFSARTSLLCFALLCFSLCLCLCLCLRYLPGKSMGSASGQSLLAGIRFGIILWMSDEANVARDFALRDLWRSTSTFCRL